MQIIIVDNSFFRFSLKERRKVQQRQIGLRLSMYVNENIVVVREKNNTYFAAETGHYLLGNRKVMRRAEEMQSRM